MEVAIVLGLGLAAAVGLACGGFYAWGWNRCESRWLRLVSERQQEAMATLGQPARTGADLLERL